MRGDAGASQAHDHHRHGNTPAQQLRRGTWQALVDQLEPNDLVVPGQRVTDHLKDHEVDFAVAIEGAGIVCVEVNGGEVWHDGEGWRQIRGGREKPIEPVWPGRRSLLRATRLRQPNGFARQPFRHTQGFSQDTHHPMNPLAASSASRNTLRTFSPASFCASARDQPLDASSLNRAGYMLTFSSPTVTVGVPSKSPPIPT